MLGTGYLVANLGPWAVIYDTKRGTELSVHTSPLCFQRGCGIIVAHFIEDETITLAQGDTGRTGHEWQSQD